MLNKDLSLLLNTHSALWIRLSDLDPILIGKVSRMESIFILRNKLLKRLLSSMDNNDILEQENKIAERK